MKKAHEEKGGNQAQASRVLSPWTHMELFNSSSIELWQHVCKVVCQEVR